jgi:hypothetical protein
MAFDVPILFLGYNRPDLTQKTLDRILEINPKFLFVSLDGPNSSKKNDVKNCKLVHEIINKISITDCILKIRINKNNLGCKISVKSAIDWFFENVEYGIILEDDCFPSHSFFPFCKELLKKYQDNERISHISGSNFQYGIWRGFESYYFSKYTHIWGWATWRRAWKDYDISMKEFEKSSLFNGVKILLPIDLMRDVYLGKIDTWDIQWFYTNVLFNRMTIVPNINLVRNIGFNSDATHTIGSIYSYIRNTPNGNLVFPLKHKKNIFENNSADTLVSLKVFGNKNDGKISKNIFKLYFIIDRIISKIKVKTFVKNLFTSEYANQNH